MKSALLFALALVLTGAPDTQPHTKLAHASVRPRPLGDGAPPYDAVWGAATHNSYWVDRDRFPEARANGVQERLLDQLLHEHVRAIELDLHRFDGHAGVFSVYHTDRVTNSLCSPLDECLKQLQLFQYLVPEHDVVNVILELKEMWGHLFDREHTIAQLDATLRRYLGDALYTPRDFLARCAPGATLRSCARSAGWPTIDRLRGRFIVNVLGNWNYNANDWVDYAARGRVAFPMRSVLDESGRRSTGLAADGVHDPLDAGALAAADEASIFWQVEALDHPEVDRFVAEHGVVRAKSAQSWREQRERIARGFQFVMTDHPWHVVDDRPDGVAPVDAARRLRAIGGDAAGELAREPGARLYAVTDVARLLMTATAPVDEPASEWETAPSTTRLDRFLGRARPRGVGCLRAAGADGRDAFMVCRQTIDGELARITLRTRHAGQLRERVLAVDSDPRSAGAAGDLIRLRVTRVGGQSCAQAASASQLRDGAPAWTALGVECFDAPLVEQGLAASGDVLFVGTRHDGAPLSAASLRAHAGALVDES